MCVGKSAAYVGSMLCKRLRSNGITYTICDCKHPVLLSRLTGNTHLIGVHDNYTCFTSLSRRYMHRLIQGALDAQAVSVSDINMTTDSGTKNYYKVV